MKARLVRIGNSRGIRLPKPMIGHAGLVDEVEFELRDSSIVIGARKAPRSGWVEAARTLAGEESDLLLETPTSTRFDKLDWRW